MNVSTQNEVLGTIYMSDVDVREETEYEGLTDYNRVIMRPTGSYWQATYRGSVCLVASNGEEGPELEFSRRGATFEEALNNLGAEAKAQKLVFLHG